MNAQPAPAPPDVRPHDLREVMRRPPDFTTPDGDTFWKVAPFGAGAGTASLWVGRFRGQSPWTLHPDGASFVHMLEGECEIELLRDGGTETVRLGPGTVGVVPRAVWHRVRSKDWVVQYGISPDATQHSHADDPRR